MKTSQKDIVIRILREEGKIDNFRCIDNRITIRLGAIIHNLTKEGWAFNTHFSIAPNQKKNFVYEVVSDPKVVRERKQQELHNYYKNR